MPVVKNNVPPKLGAEGAQILAVDHRLLPLAVYWISPPGSQALPPARSVYLILELLLKSVIHCITQTGDINTIAATKDGSGIGDLCPIDRWQHAGG